jgi:hypothetical protein
VRFTAAGVVRSSAFLPTMSQHSEDSAWYRRMRPVFLAAHPICHICGHPGTDEIDHDPPISKAPWVKGDMRFWLAAHGVRGCPLCPLTVSADKRRHGKTRKCNQSRGARMTVPDRPTSRQW